MRLRFRDNLRGRSVIDSSGRVVGEVEDVVIDTDRWQVAALRLRLKREVATSLGVRSGTFRSAVLDVPSDAVQSSTDTVVLRHDLKDLLPTGPSGPPQAPVQH